MKVTFSESLNILSSANIEKTFPTCKNHVFKKNALKVSESSLMVTRVVPSNIKLFQIKKSNKLWC